MGKLIAAVFLYKWTPILGFFSVFVSMAVFYLGIMPLVTKQPSSGTPGTALILLLLIFIAGVPLYCAGLSVYFLVEGKNVAVSVFGVILNGGWLALLVLMVWLGSKY